MNRGIPFGTGNGPGHDRNYGNRGRRPGSNDKAPRQYGGATVKKLGPDDLDALFSTVGRVRFVAFDFETTGLSPQFDRVVEIGAVSFSMIKEKGSWKARVDGEFSTLVNPGRPIPSEVSAIHGIDDLAVSAAPDFSRAAADFCRFIENAILVAHNAPFDVGFLKAEASRAGIPVPANPAYDTIAIAKTAVSGLPSYSLKALAASFGIIQNAAHRGADDARVCMELFTKCLNLLDTEKS